MLCNDFKLTVLFSKSVEFDPQEYQSLATMHYNTMKSLFSYLVLPMDFAHHLLNPSILLLSRNPIGGQITMML
jgi:hypothetical protein